MVDSLILKKAKNVEVEMRILVVFLAVIALGGAAFGSYALFIQPLPGVEPAVEAVGGVGADKLLALEGEIGILREKYEQRITYLENRIETQEAEVARLKTRTAQTPSATASAPGSEGAPPAAPVQIEGMDRENLKQLLGELSEERRRDERESQFDRMQTQFTERRNRQVDNIAEKLKWDDSKKQQVLDILAQEREKTQGLWEQMRNRDLSQEERQQLGDQMRQINEQTQEALKALLPEEEYKSLQNSLRSRRDRGTGRGGRFTPGRGRGNR
jgi:hypothetical protein